MGCCRNFDRFICLRVDNTIFAISSGSKYLILSVFNNFNPHLNYAVEKQVKNHSVPF